jgi:hypothetical protein
MFAGLSGIESIGTLMSPLFSLGYSLTVSSYGEAMFLVMSVLTGCSALIIFHVRNRKLIQIEEYSPSHCDDNDMKEPILSAPSRPDGGSGCDGAAGSRAASLSSGGAHARANVKSRALSIASNATYGGDRQISLSVAF